MGIGNLVKCRLVVLLSAATLALARPYYSPYQHYQRQLFYSAPPALPQYSPYQQPFLPYQVPQYPGAPALPYRQVYYAPQPNNLISSVRYPAAAPASPVVYYPGGPVVLDGTDSSAETGGQWFNTDYWSGLYNSWVGGAAAKPPAAAEAPSNAEAGSGMKVEVESTDKGKDKEPAKEEEKESEEQKKPDEGANKLKYQLIGEPQFFGNFGLQRMPVNPAFVVPSANNGGVSSYLFLKNFPFVKTAAPQVLPQAIPQAPLVPLPPLAPLEPQEPQAADPAPGSAAVDYQKLLQAARQQKDIDEDDSSVTVDADPKGAPEAAAAAADDVKDSDEEPGPTIAQAKPKAVAMAGPGGVAAAAPVATALVGPGGMALSAPEATAVAGAKGASSAMLSPATTKLVSKAARTYQLANHNLQYLLSL